MGSPNLVSFTVAPIFILGVALPLFLAPIFSKVFLSMSHFVAHFLPLGRPLTLGPFLVLIEIIRVLIRPLTLSLRLSANLLAGHIVLRLLRMRVLMSTF